MILLTEYFKSSLEERNNEVVTSIKNNVKSGLFNQIILLNEEDILDIEGVTNEITSQRLTYKYAFEYNKDLKHLNFNVALKLWEILLGNKFLFIK